jgi:cell division protein ZapE
VADTPLAAWRALVRAGGLEHDTAQELAAEKLTLLHHRLGRYAPGARTDGGFLSRLGFANSAPAAAAPEGLYIFGDVGRGKSMLMDLFFARAPVRRKRRVHFHAFMLEVHARIAEWRREGRAGGTRIGADPIPPVAGALGREAWLLCFDEFQVEDPADALILGRLFGALFETGVVVVTTSNTAPGDLYAGGLNRERFLPFLEVFADNMDVLELGAGTDYRRQLIRGKRVYFTPIDDAAGAGLDAVFDELAGGARGAPQTIALAGRTLAVPSAARGIARFSFAELCERPLGAADYLAIAGLYHTLIVSGIPLLAREKRNEAKRLATLVDALYEHRVKLVCSAAGPPEALYPAGDGVRAFARTVSRLHEMQSAAYLAAPHLT